jgi:hypothetical protein
MWRTNKPQQELAAVPKQGMLKEVQTQTDQTDDLIERYKDFVRVTQTIHSLSEFL